MWEVKWDPPDRVEIENVTALLIRTFPQNSPSQHKLQAQALLEAPDWAIHMYHNGTRDRDELVKLQKTLQKAEHIFSNLSQWSQNSLGSQMLRQYLDADPELGKQIGLDRRNQPLPLALSEITHAMEAWREAAFAVESSLNLGRPGHGLNFRMIALIDDARKTWKTNTGKWPSPRSLNPDTRFYRFLLNLCETLQMHGDLEHYYEKWFEYASDPNSYFDNPMLER